MTIGRRQLMGSLAAAAVCPPVASAHGAAPAAPTRVNHQGRQSPEGWFLAKESCQQPTDHVVDFWERPFCDIAYTQYLPPEIARGAMCYEAFDGAHRPTRETIDRSTKKLCRDWIGRPRFAAHLDGIETLPSTLRSLIEHEGPKSTARTAFISLDSLGPWREPSWSEVLPAFRSCYDHIIGHFHLSQRGLRQERKLLNGSPLTKSGRGYFEEFFTDAAAQCDAVILTSPALVESDLRCCPRASTEELVGKLMRHLGCAC